MMKIAVFVHVYEGCVHDPQLFDGEDCEEKAKQAFYEHTNVHYDVFQNSEAQGELLEITSDTAGSDIYLFKKGEKEDQFSRDINF